MGFRTWQGADHPSEDQPVGNHTNHQGRGEGEEANSWHTIQAHHFDESIGNAGVTHSGDGEGHDQREDQTNQHHQVLELADDEVIGQAIDLPHLGSAHAQVGYPAQSGPERQEQRHGEDGFALRHGIFDDGLEGLAHLATGTIGDGGGDLVHQILVAGQHHGEDGKGQHEQREQGEHGEVRDACRVLIAAVLGVALLHAHDVIEPLPLIAVLIDHSGLIFAGALHTAFIQVRRVGLGDHSYAIFLFTLPAPMPVSAPLPNFAQRRFRLGGEVEE